MLCCWSFLSQFSDRHDFDQVLFRASGGKAGGKTDTSGHSGQRGSKMLGVLYIWSPTLVSVKFAIKIVGNGHLPFAIH